MNLGKSLQTRLLWQSTVNTFPFLTLFNLIQPNLSLFSLGAPKFLTKPSDTIAIKDQPVKFESTIDGFPKPKIQWFLNDKEITAKDKEYRIEGSNLAISKISSTHLGKFKIVASNSVSSVEHTFELNVIGKLFELKLCLYILIFMCNNFAKFVRCLQNNVLNFDL